MLLSVDINYSAGFDTFIEDQIPFFVLKCVLFIKTFVLCCWKIAIILAYFQHHVMLTRQKKKIALLRQLNVHINMGFVISLFMFRRSLRFFYICCICFQIKTRYAQICLPQFVCCFADFVRFDLSAAPRLQH